MGGVSRGEDVRYVAGGRGYGQVCQEELQYGTGAEAMARSQLPYSTYCTVAVCRRYCKDCSCSTSTGMAPSCLAGVRYGTVRPPYRTVLVVASRYLQISSEREPSSDGRQAARSYRRYARRLQADLVHRYSYPAGADFKTGLSPNERRPPAFEYYIKVSNFHCIFWVFPSLP